MADKTYLHATNGSASICGNINDADLTLTLTMTKLSMDDIRTIRDVLSKRASSALPCLHATALIDDALSRT